MEKVTVKIDGEPVEIEKGKTILDAAKKVGASVPGFCYNELWNEGSEDCRMCVVEVVDGGPEGLVASCNQPVNDGLAVETKSPEVYSSRRNTLELFLSEHSQKCRDCNKSGNCELAELSKKYDVSFLPVCADCSLQGQSCLLSKDMICLGPLTYSGCSIICPEEDYQCIGCRGLNTNEDIVRFALTAYEKNDISLEDVLEEVRYIFPRKSEDLKETLEDLENE